MAYEFERRNHTQPRGPHHPNPLRQSLHHRRHGPGWPSFALVSSTNVAKALNLWTPEQTNTAGTARSSFSVTPGSAKARFFRVITQP